MSENARIDENNRKTLLAVDDSTGELRRVRCDSNGRLLVAGTVASAFTSLTDTPSSYAGQGGKVVAVNDEEDGLEFVDAATGSGDVTGPASSTDNAIARFDSTTGKIIQNSVVTIADTTGNMAGVGTVNTLTLPTSNFVGLTDTQTLTNKTLTLPVIDDENGNEVLLFEGVASANNYLKVKNANNNFPELIAEGDDTNVGIYLTTKGTGKLYINLNEVIDEASSQFMSGKNISAANNVYRDASTTVIGAVELATDAEVTTGTDTTRAITPDALAQSDFGKRLLQVQVIASDADLEVGDGAGNFRWFVPAELNGWEITAVHVAVTTAGTTGTTDVQIHNVTDAVDVLSTKATVDSGEKTSYTASTPPVVNGSNNGLTTGHEFRVDIDAVSTTTPKGLNVLFTLKKA